MQTIANGKKMCRHAKIGWSRIQILSASLAAGDAGEHKKPAPDGSTNIYSEWDLRLGDPPNTGARERTLIWH